MSTRRLAPIHLVLGLVIWSGWFVLLYGGLSVACEFAPPDTSQGARTWVNFLMIALAILLTGVLLYVSYRCSQWGLGSVPDPPGSPRAFIRKMALSVYLISAAGAFALAIPVMVLPPCV
ncbi:hypothetical protein [Marinobacter sp.]|uniref:hypothetical protein n=1 Tax=Marinobacter sp. TaxID=50741 RepID=UPI0034A460D9